MRLSWCEAIGTKIIFIHRQVKLVFKRKFFTLPRFESEGYLNSKMASFARAKVDTFGPMSPAQLFAIANKRKHSIPKTARRQFITTSTYSLKMANEDVLKTQSLDTVQF